MPTEDTFISSTGRPLPPAAVAWIRHFKMERIPQEGAWFAPAFQSDETIAAGSFSQPGILRRDWPTTQSTGSRQPMISQGCIDSGPMSCGIITKAAPCSC